jgi:4-hydroxybutyrate CoA-transferase
MDWRDEYKRKLVTPEEAVKQVKSGDIIRLGWVITCPYTLCQALGRRKDELEGIDIINSATVIPQPWHQPGYEKAFRLVDTFVSAFDRPLVDQKRIDVLHLDTVLQLRQYTDRRRAGRRQVFMRQVSPPDEHGYCSLGEAIWYARDAIENCDLVIGEVVPGLIRTYGESYAHVSEIAFFAPCDPSFKHEHAATERVGLVLKDDKEVEIASVIGATVASELIKDGDVIQIGGGAVSAAIGGFLHDKHDLGIHSEIITGGIVDLVKEGVITGRTKKVHPGKVTATCCSGLANEELSYIDNNPAFELYRVSHTNDPRVISGNDNVVTINNALAVDFSGQVASDSLGPRLYSGVGGQLDFALGAMMSQGGRSITVLPATAIGGAVSRIVPTLVLGQGVSIPRGWVDYVVTEYGIASLFGKTSRERAEELISIAHPDFRAELRKKAQELSIL